MPSYYYKDRHHSKDGYEIAHHITRELRHSHRPTQCIINEGKLIIDERSLEDRDRSSSSRSNTVIYNAPGSTMWIEKHRDDRSHYLECRGCSRRCSRSYDGYCSDCVTLRFDSPRRHEIVTVSDRRLLEYPERRAIQWR
ncbi:hypothetical protein ONZ43_g3360 [Nemania bipapillata]|uniref:Uncharacterized protein n=1 Tax=Nemania bipapillata TaxID=110536 RepID=A0ACC2IX23_9PEZI|nr:hypothetical protein ONZ43_g3360 [Nemania bipapillata]